MKRTIILLFVLAFAVSISASIVLLDWEDENPEEMHPVHESPDSVIVYEVSVPAGSWILATWNVCLNPYQNGLIEAHIRLDEEVIPWTLQRCFEGSNETHRWGSSYAAGSYQAAFDSLSGEHKIQLIVTCRDTFSGGYYKRTGFQVRIDIPESEAAVCEQPDDDSNYDPFPQSLITASNSLILPGAVAVYDKVGREVDGIIYGDRIIMDALPAGQYFVRTNTASNHVVKVVKIR